MERLTGPTGGAFSVRGCIVLRLLTRWACPRRALRWGNMRSLTRSWTPPLGVLTWDHPGLDYLIDVIDTHLESHGLELGGASSRLEHPSFGGTEVHITVYVQ